MVGMMNRAGEAADRAALLQRRQRVAGDRILRMKDIELAVLRVLKMPEIIGDANAHHLGDILADG